MAKSLNNRQGVGGIEVRVAGITRRKPIIHVKQHNIDLIQSNFHYFSRVS